MKNFSFENQLIHETSPYLLQHAHNPVNWYPWGEEAFELARETNKPIFVSIGYSTCHWCHRMAEDCFEDEEVAALLNDYFISVKVDREERPDIDQIYMNICQMLTGSGGWPLHVFLTPNQLPFYAGTYFPKYSIGNQAGMLDILPYLTKVYEEQQDRVMQIGEGLRQGLIEQSTTARVKMPPNMSDKAYEILMNHYDGIYGGFGSAPKFPNVTQLHFLLKYGKAQQNEQAYAVVEKTLDQLYRGGIYDHLGGGFARYAVDQQWHIPHFEKMLYDQAQLMMIYAEGYQLFKKPLYKQIIEEIFAFLQREMRSEEGNYSSAIDADSEGREGAYYVWHSNELPSEFAQAYGAVDAPHLDGQYVLNLIENEQFETVAKTFEKDRERLLALREQRIHPHIDTKQLTGWNALLVAALAKAGTAINRPEIVEEAQNLMTVLQSKHMIKGRLKMTAQTDAAAYLDDYSYMLWAYTELYEATQQAKYLQQAKEIANYIIANFSHTDGGFTASSQEHEQLIVNQKTAIDGALPPGNGVIAVEFYRLARLVEDEVFERLALQQLDVFSQDLMTYPTSSLCLLQVELFDKVNGFDYKFTGEAEEVFARLQQQYRPFDLWKTVDDSKAEFSMEVCQKYSCQLKVESIEDAKKNIC